jgi:hypothetical protein
VALLDLQSELAGMLPGLSPILAKTYINRALTGIYGERLWSFLLMDAAIVCPAVIDDGTIAITQYSASVTLDATASAAIATQLDAGGAEPGIRKLQIRFSAGSPAASQIYSITDYDDSTPTAIILTLDRVVMETTSATSTYQIFRNLIVPPIPDFLRWESFVDFANAITLTGNRLTLSSAIFDAQDPQRTANGLAYNVGAWGGNRIDNAVTGSTVPQSQSDDSTPIFELWPVPTNGQTWYVRLRRRGAELVQPSDVQPDGISDDLIIQRALYKHAYPFAQANVANFPSFKGANWALLVAQARTFYKDELQEAKRNDQEKSLQTSDIWNRGHGLRPIRPFGRYDVQTYPIDANFLQSHLIRF